MISKEAQTFGALTVTAAAGTSSRDDRVRAKSSTTLYLIGLGVAKLLLGWLTFGLWPLIDWIIILVGAAHDGDGLPVTNWG